MTINHVFVYVTAQRMPAMRSFYRNMLKPLGYTEMINANGNKTIGYGSDFPYLWLQQVPEGHKPYPVHVAIDAPDNNAVDEFHRIALSNDGTDNGKPGIREEMSRQPYYAAFVHDLEGNNLEAVCVDKTGIRAR
ncbi:glyoxalase/Bleomycin resistance protein/Dioxygenase superfamily protein [Lentithecium fluviatile CBS 122367]|uniref:Glyoxalase/Bleomycin resistance protein/Dioxygenase superfamily protein n=1 Tax=Lentithecium fluviatile CBS 122367 TaxID=1168545 RepID=A0A6G1IE70_9PLEO|nr:glyoxalase/Bleomycin resistance protein/Dioxygenase superfamily protein [Lentithecium fluviatile CBS 122367]